MWSQLWIAWFVSWLYQGWSATSYVCRQNPLCQPSNLPILEQVISRFGDAWRIETVFSGGWSKNDWGDTNSPWWNPQCSPFATKHLHWLTEYIWISVIYIWISVIYQSYISHISVIYQSYIIFISPLHCWPNDHLPSTPFAGWAETAAAPLRHSARRHRPSPRSPAARSSAWEDPKNCDLQNTLVFPRNSHFSPRNLWLFPAKWEESLKPLC